MITGRNILCISNPTWEGNYAKTIVELMKVFSLHNNVLYVDYQFTMKDVVSSLTGKGEAPVKRMYGIHPNLRQFETSKDSHVSVLTPPPIIPNNFLPHNKLFKFIQGYNSAVIRSSINKALKKLNMRDDLIVIVAFSPGLGLYLQGAFNENVHLYHCYDEIGASVWAKEHGPTFEKAYMPKADGVIVTSQGLLETKKPLSKQCWLVPNGVNYDLFNQALNLQLTKQNIVVGYVGSIDDRLDYDLLDYCFKKFTSYTFTFVGRIMYEEGAQRLRSYPNVKIESPRPVHELPLIIKTFHAGLIPFVKNDFTMGVYPLKINEYLAAGLPVIMTPFSKIAGFDGIVEIHQDKQDFANALQNQIVEDTPEKKLLRAKVGKSNDWESRVDSISDIIIEIEKQKGAEIT